MSSNPRGRASHIGRRSEPSIWAEFRVWNLPTAIGAASTVLCAAIYFELNRHDWFFRLLGIESNLKVNLLFLIGLFLLAIMYRSSRRQPVRVWAKTGMGSAFFVVLVLFAYFGGFSVVLNEPGLDEIQSYLFYLYTPILVMMSVVVLHQTDRSIRRTLVVLLFGALILSAYSTILHYRGSSGADLTLVYTNASSSVQVVLARKGVPGLGSNMFPSMLVPMVLASLYFALKRQASVQWVPLAAAIFLVVNLLLTASRSALLSLALALMYLGVRRWFRLNFKLVLAGVSLMVVFAVFGGFALERFERSVLVQGFTEGVTGSASTRADGYDDRLLVSLDSLSFYFAQHPIVGAGFTSHLDSQRARNLGSDENLYTQLLARGGLFVGVPFAMILLLIYRNAALMLRRCRHDPQAVALGTILVAGFIGFLFNMNFTTGFIHYFAVWWGLLVAWTRNEHIRQLGPPRGVPRTARVQESAFPLRPAGPLVVRAARG